MSGLVITLLGIGCVLAAIALAALATSPDRLTNLAVYGGAVAALGFLLMGWGWITFLFILITLVVAALLYTETPASLLGALVWVPAVLLLLFVTYRSAVDDDTVSHQEAQQSEHDAHQADGEPTTTTTDSDRERETTTTTVGTTTTTEADTPTTAPDAGECVGGFDVWLSDRGDQFYLFADGIPATNRNNPEGFRTYIRDRAQHDPVVLFLFYQGSPLGVRAPLNEPHQLVTGGAMANGNCYTEEAITLYNEWVEWWDSASITARDPVTFRDYKAGVSFDHNAFYREGVTGAVAGYDITYVDSSNVTPAGQNGPAQHSVLYHSGQLTFAVAPPLNIPPGDLP